MEAPERRPAEGLGEVGTRDRELWSRDGGRKRDRDGGEAADTEKHRNKGGGMRVRKEGEGLGEEEGLGGAEMRQAEPGGEKTGRREGRQLAWRSRAGVAQPCLARPGPAPSDSAAATLGPYHEVSPALGLRENKWCPR